MVSWLDLIGALKIEVHALRKHNMNYLELIFCLKIKDLRL
jgi:hypothetical protein